MELGNGGRQVHGVQDLLDDVAGLDECDETQGALTPRTFELEPEGSLQKLGPGDVPRLACRFYSGGLFPFCTGRREIFGIFWDDETAGMAMRGEDAKIVGQMETGRRDEGG